MSERLPIVLFGATGYTGELIARELDRRGVAFAISGRDRNKLEALRRTLATRPEVIIAATGDPAALERMASRARVVLSCAGPFIDLGPPVQEAALAAGSHFLDISGEAQYMLQTWRERHERARARGVALINGVGFDVVATDLPAWLACQGLGAIDRVEMAIVNKGGASAGTMRSMLRGVRETSLGFENGEYVEAPPGRFVRRIDFPQPEGPGSAISLPWGDIATAPRTTGARTVRVYFKVPALAAMIVPRVAPLAKIARLEPIYERMQKRIASRPAGPSEEERARSSFLVWVGVTAMDGRKRVVTMKGPGSYNFTVVSAVECAIRAADPSFDRSGALTPSQAFDVNALIASLEPHGVKVNNPS